MTPTLPEMSRQEASWHQHLAAMRAAETARKQGGNPAAIAAVASATAGAVEIGGFRLMPASEGTIWTLKRAAVEFRAWADAHGLPRAGDDAPDGTREMLELGLSILIFCDSRRCWIDLETSGIGLLIVRADELVWDLNVETSRALERHFQREMQRIRELTPADEDTPPGKLPAAGANGTSPAMPTPPAAADSPR